MGSLGTKVWLLYVVGSISFLLLPLLFAPGTPSFEMFKSSHLRRDLASYSLILAFYFLNLHYLIPRFLFRKRHVLYWGVMLMLMLVIVVLPTVLLRHHPHYPNATQYHNGIHLYSFSHPFFVYLVALFFSLLIAFQTRYKQSERNRLRTELAYLKAQINPHFLFNSLNSIYALAIEKSDLAPEAVLKLSGLMRYALEQAEKEVVGLQREIDYLSDYIALQRIRLGDTVKIMYDVRVVGAHQQQIAPLVLIPFVENAFKHGVNPEGDSMISIRIGLEGNRLSLHVVNNKIQRSADLEDRKGIGLSNTRDRLQVLYPDRHQLLIHDDDVQFSVSLNIEL